MKKLFLVFAIVMLSLTGLYAQQGEKSIGFKLNYGEEISNFGIGAQFSYNILEQIRISPGFNYFFKNNNWSMFNIDLDGHYLFPFADKFAAYPIGGFTFQSWKWKWNGPNGNVSETMTRFGLNAGGGIQYDFAENWRVYSELKYSIVKDYSQFNASIGIAFRFF